MGQHLDEKEREGSIVLRLALEELCKAVGRNEMPLQYLITFLMVAREEGLSATEYAKRASVSLTVMSRHILDIGERDRRMQPGMGLIYKKQDPRELRRRQVFLTPKGRALALRVASVFKLLTPLTPTVRELLR